MNFSVLWFGNQKHPWAGRQWRRVVQFVGLFGLCFAIALGCAGNNQPAAEVTAADESSRIAIGTTLTARTLDPADAYETFPGILLYNLGDRLYTYEPGTTNLVPQLATAMPTVSADGLTYTIPLRDDVTLHDDTPFNAEVMAFSIQRFMENGGRPAYLLADKIASAEATAEHELTLTLKAPFAAFPALLSFSGVTPVSPQSYEIGSGSFSPDSFVGTGPYKLASFTSDSIKLDVNESYWGEAPANDGIDIQIFTSPANLYNTFTTGGLDIAYQTLDPDQIAALERDANSGGWQVIEAGTNVINYMALNQKIAPLDNVTVRQAIAAMIDRPLINERVFQGQAEPLYSLIPASFDIAKPVFKEAYGDGNFAKAKTLLGEAGFSETQPLNVEIWYPSASTTRSIVANTLKESIEAGLPGLVTVTVQNTEGATLWENVGKGIYPIILSNWYPDYYDPDTFIQPFMSCETGSNQICEAGPAQATGSFYYSPKANELVTKQQAEQDPVARQMVITEIQQLMVEDVPYIPLWQNKDYVFAQDGVEGVAIEPTQQFLLWQIERG
ncbi:peptide ABC transporter substrate-binding protein [Nodosilinea sp. LEGE 07088]|uniref:ABC transporter substrate-binding protein n=1 Tax=Nodosilinea sp. LEGE 07088 TaxID=2777968 RepID=UPI0018823F26|nr:ABC transporter substrate-binding protein [Nodosilinea sp. LEGE 07088]MBE9138994.1 peptide ABC transporter substrate-binding protein [Nodosilinea sp. LEGE 07088]